MVSSFLQTSRRKRPRTCLCTGTDSTVPVKVHTIMYITVRLSIGNKTMQLGENAEQYHSIT